MTKIYVAGTGGQEPTESRGCWWPVLGALGLVVGFAAYVAFWFEHPDQPFRDSRYNASRNTGRSPAAVSEPLPTFAATGMTFNGPDGVIGRLDWSEGSVRFEGDFDESARVFFELFWEEHVGTCGEGP